MNKFITLLLVLSISFVVGQEIQKNQKDNYLIITSIFECKQSVLSASYFSELKELYDKIVAQENQEIILTKI